LSSLDYTLSTGKRAESLKLQPGFPGDATKQN